MFFLVNVAKIQFSYLIYCAINIPLTQCEWTWERQYTVVRCSYWNSKQCIFSWGSNWTSLWRGNHSGVRLHLDSHSTRWSLTSCGKFGVI